MYFSEVSNAVKLTSPWAQYCQKVKAMFGKDPEVKIIFDEENYILNLYVNNTDKAEAIRFLLGEQVVFGNVVLKVNVYPPNKKDMDILGIFEEAFKGNPVMDFTKSVEHSGGVFKFVIFKKEVVQFYNDDISDINGQDSTLYEDIADDIFTPIEDVHYCTNSYAKIEPYYGTTEPRRIRPEF